MISQAGPWTQAPSATSLQPKKMKCSFLDYVQLLMISCTGQWTRMPSTTPLQPKTWNACFWITFNFWWLARLVDALEPHLPPLSSQKNEMLIFGLCSTSDDWPGWSMDSNPICHPSPTKNMICSFLDYVQLLMIGRAGQWTQTPSTTALQPKKWNAGFWITFTYWWSARLVDGLEPHLPPISSQKHEMLIFGLCSTSNDQMAWLIDSNPICNPSAARKMKCSFLDYIQLLMISWAGPWIQTPSATALQPQKWNVHFWILFNFWWLDRLVNGLKPHLQPISSQKNEMLIFGLRSISDDRPGWLIDLNPIHHPSASKKMKCSFLDYVQLLMISRAGRCTQIPSATSLQPKIWNAHFKIMFNFWRLAGLVDGLKQHLQLLCSQKNEMLIFGFCSTSDDWTGWSMDSNPICDPSPAIKMKCLFLVFVQLLMIGRAGRWTQTPSPAKIMKCSFLDYIQLLIIGWAGRWTQTPSPAKIMKCSFLDYVQLLMISWAGQWTRTLSATCLQPLKWNAHFWITFNFWWLAGLVNGLEPHLPPLSSHKKEMLIFGLHSTSDDQLAGQWTRTPYATPLQPKKWNAHFWIMFNFWWLAGLVDGLKPHIQPK